MEEYEKLTESQKEKVREFINNNIDSVYDERVSYRTCIETYGNGAEIEDDPDAGTEFIERNFVGYYCNECYDYIDEKDDDYLILHVIQHLKSKMTLTKYRK